MPLAVGAASCLYVQPNVNHVNVMIASALRLYINVGGRRNYYALFKADRFLRQAAPHTTSRGLMNRSRLYTNRPRIDFTASVTAATRDVQIR